MEHLFAPWRIDWIRRDEQNPDIEGCVFCGLPDRSEDRANRIVARGDHAYVLLNNFPYNPGHLMVIPYRHIGSYAGLPEEVRIDHGRVKQRAFKALQRALEPDGFNAGMNIGEGSGGSISDHLHSHIVPRWEGDTNFMPVVGDTKVIVEAIDETYADLHAAFAEQDGATSEGLETAVSV